LAVAFDFDRLRSGPFEGPATVKPPAPPEDTYKLTSALVILTLERMEVDFSPDLQTKLNRLAAEQGRDTKALVQEAVERFVRHDEWFIRGVEKGLAAADRGEFIEHEEIGKIIDGRYPG